MLAFGGSQTSDACMQVYCEPHLQDGKLFAWEDGSLQRLLTWAALYAPTSTVLTSCCGVLAKDLTAALQHGLLEAVASHDDCTNSIVAGLFVSIDHMLQQAVQCGGLDQMTAEGFGSLTNL